MQKRYLILLMAALMFVGCAKKSAQQEAQEQVVNEDVKATFEDMCHRLEMAYGAAETEIEQQALAETFVDSVYLLLSENMGAPYTDTLFSMVAVAFSDEQRQELFDKMPTAMRENELIKPLYEAAQIRIKTSPGAEYTNFTAVSPEGKEISLSDLIGKTDYVFVDFWASWCGPCRRLIPVLKEIYASQPAGRLQIFSCSVDEEESAWRKALEEEQMPWIQAREDNEHKCSYLYGVQYIPYTILVDKDGKIVGVNLDEAEIEEILIK